MQNYRGKYEDGGREGAYAKQSESWIRFRKILVIFFNNFCDTCQKEH